jgi:hypothetical protein
MAGLGEVCSHVAATLFSVLEAIEMQKTTCTSKPCEWIKATKGNDDIYMEGCDINFSTPSKKFKTLGKENKPPSTPSKKQVMHKVCAKTKSDRMNFFKMLHETGTKSAVLQLVPGYSQMFPPKSVEFGLPTPLSELFDKECLNINFAALIKKCDDAFQRIEFNHEKVCLVNLLPTVNFN